MFYNYSLHRSNVQKGAWKQFPLLAYIRSATLSAISTVRFKINFSALLTVLLKPVAHSGVAVSDTQLKRGRGGTH